MSALVQSVQQVQIAPSALGAPGASVVSAASNPLGLLHQLHPIVVFFQKPQYFCSSGWKGGPCLARHRPGHTILFFFFSFHHRHTKHASPIHPNLWMVMMGSVLCSEVLWTRDTETVGT